MSLLLHCGAFSATYSDLLASQLPSATSTYEPIPLNATGTEALRRYIKMKREEKNEA